MRRLAVIFASCVCLQLAAVSPAHAWWDYIEQFSGPGPFRGFDIEARLVCWHERIPANVAGYPSAQQSTTPNAGTGTQQDKGFRRTSFTPGAIVSACRRIDHDERRRASFDVGMRFVWDQGDTRFANGKRISLTTLEPAFSWNPIPAGWFDWFDYGIGAGVYWFSSEEFESHSGAFLEPVRLDIHAPSRCTSRWCGLLLVRGSLLVFPAGFERFAFDARRDVAERISRDWVPTAAIFVDLERLTKRSRTR